MAAEFSNKTKKSIGGEKMKKTIMILITLSLTLLMLSSSSTIAFAATSTSASTELINYTGMSTSEINTFINLCSKQGFTEITLRLNAMYDWRSERPSSSEVYKAKQIITAANAAGISVNIDLHTWYTTWDRYFRDGASNYANNRADYLNYVKAAIDSFKGYNVKAWMLLNEPQARRASYSENKFILSIISAAKSRTSRPVSVRFMCGYSPSTGHYSSEIDEATDFIARNTYWDPRNPSRSVYGTTESKMNTAINYAKSNNKELWITEFGKSKSDAYSQRDYVKAFVDYAKSKGIARIFAWVSQPEGGYGESYNIFNGYRPNLAFYELENNAASGSTSSSYTSYSSDSSQSSNDSSEDDSSTSSYSYSRYSRSSYTYSRYSSYRWSR